MSRRVALVVAVALLAAGAALLGHDGYLTAKGALANRLVERALAVHLEDGRAHRPWDWADFTPIARLRVPRLGISRPVLSDASGECLAFGLGLVGGTAPPGAPGHTVLAGHRDSWAAFMKDLSAGDRLVLETKTKNIFYQIVRSRVIGAGDSGVLSEADAPDLSLITCYPIDGYMKPTQRYQIMCIRTAY